MTKQEKRDQTRARVDRHREAKREQGLIPLHGIWCHPEDAKAIRILVERRNARRGIG